MSNEFPESNSMLDDLLATDAPPDEAESFGLATPLTFNTVEGFTPIDMRLLASPDFAILIGCLMRRLGLAEVTISDAERQGLDSSDPTKCTVLVCEANNSTADIRFTLHETVKSEFRP